jgi:four helix bundle protein
MARPKFLFEELEVWKKAVVLAEKSIDFALQIRADQKQFRVIDQFVAASTSVSLNIAEGKGRYSKKEFIQFLYIARGSLYETVTLLTIFHRKRWLSDQQHDELENLAEEINKMISGLIVSIRNS